MPWILTFTGQQMDPMHPDPAQINVYDIATGLANTCRFAGQCNRYYSVAQHSVLASYHVVPSYALDALLHDAAEAYLCDMPMPAKVQLPDYREMEARMNRAICERFDLRWSLSGDDLGDPENPRLTPPPAVKDIDLRLLATERRDLMAPDPDRWPCLEGVDPLKASIEPMPPEEARAAFLRRFREIVTASEYEAEKGEGLALTK